MKLNEQVAELVKVLYEDLDTPTSLGCYLRVKYGEWGQLVTKTVSPLDYCDALQYSLDVMATSFLRKSQDVPVEKGSRRSHAIRSFFESEAGCKATNRRLSPFLDNYGFNRTSEKLVPFVERCQRLIKMILGPLPLDLAPKFGPGAVFESKSYKHPFFTVADKMALGFTTTPGAVDLFPFVERSAWGRAECNLGRSVTVVPGNRFTTVPKDYRDRGICIEPGVNVALQLAVGSHIRNRLKRFGLDLNIGQDVHRDLAREGSLTGEWATMDLSNASDTIAKNLVRLLVPEDWFWLLDSLRSPKTLVDGKWWVLEKFSSMGNGFTFELETLIFAVIVSIATGGRLGEDVFAFGDDLIYPSHKHCDVRAALSFFGFTPNDSKSFASGPFRESCGGDYFSGREVRPFFLKADPSDPAEWIACANGIRRNFRLPGGWRCERAWKRALSFIPSDVRKCRGPAELGDLLINDDPDRWNYVLRSGIRYFRVYRPVGMKVPLVRYSPDLQFASVLYGAARTMRGGTAYLGSRVRAGVPEVCGHRFGRVAFS